MVDLSKISKIYIAIGYSDLRRGIDGYASMIQNSFHENPQNGALFLFCGRRSDRIKCLYWDNLSAHFCYPHLFLQSTSLQ